MAVLRCSALQWAALAAMPLPVPLVLKPPLDSAMHPPVVGSGGAESWRGGAPLPRQPSASVESPTTLYHRSPSAPSVLEISRAAPSLGHGAGTSRGLPNTSGRHLTPPL